MCINNAHQGFQSLICCSKEGPGDHVGLPCDTSDRQCKGELKHMFCESRLATGANRKVS